jgi:RimJ/RimL family protein N-acetyltransferase
MTFIHADNDKGLPVEALLGRVCGVKFPEDVPLLSDGVVTLRAHTSTDARGSYEQCQDPLSQAWTTVPLPYSMADAREFVEGIVPQGWREDRDYAFAVEAPDDDGTLRYAGTVSLRPEGSRRAEIAYGSHPWCRGRGVMERALRILLDWGFDELDLAMVIWWANRGNWASRKLAWRLGFTMDGAVRSWLPQRGELRDAWVGSLLPTDKREPRSDWFDVPVITGHTLVLRGYRDDDASRVQQACSHERTQHWLRDLPSPYTIEDARAYLETRKEQLATGSGITWAIADPGTDALLGTISLFDLKPGFEAEIGYWAHPDARGRGVMTEACGLVVRHAFIPAEDGGLGLQRVSILAGVDNTASRRVIEANGFTLFGVERQGTRMRDGTLMDTACYDLLVSEWPARSEDRA